MIALHGPFLVTISFAMTNGEQVVKADFECPPGELPTLDKLATLAENCKAQVREQLGEDFDWQCRRDFVGDIMAERSGGMRFAVPGPENFQLDLFNT